MFETAARHNAACIGGSGIRTKINCVRRRARFAWFGPQSIRYNISFVNCNIFPAIGVRRNLAEWKTSNAINLFLSHEMHFFEHSHLVHINLFFVRFLVSALFLSICLGSTFDQIYMRIKNNSVAATGGSLRVYWYHCTAACILAAAKRDQTRRSLRNRMKWQTTDLQPIH